MSFFKEFAGYLLGEMSPAYFAASLTFILFGAGVTVMLDVYTRNRESGRSPEPFCWPFFWRDNRLRFILNIVIAVFVIRFFNEMTGMGRSPPAFHSTE